MSNSSEERRRRWYETLKYRLDIIERLDVNMEFYVIEAVEEYIKSLEHSQLQPLKAKLETEKQKIQREREEEEADFKDSLKRLKNDKQQQESDFAAKRKAVEAKQEQKSENLAKLAQLKIKFQKLEEEKLIRDSQYQKEKEKLSIKREQEQEIIQENVAILKAKIQYAKERRDILQPDKSFGMPESVFKIIIVMASTVIFGVTGQQIGDVVENKLFGYLVPPLFGAIAGFLAEESGSGIFTANKMKKLYELENKILDEQAD